MGKTPKEVTYQTIFRLCLSKGMSVSESMKESDRLIAKWSRVSKDFGDEYMLIMMIDMLITALENRSNYQSTD